MGRRGSREGVRTTVSRGVGGEGAAGDDGKGGLQRVAGAVGVDAVVRVLLIKAIPPFGRFWRLGDGAVHEALLPARALKALERHRREHALRVGDALEHVTELERTGRGMEVPRARRGDGDVVMMAVALCLGVSAYTDQGSVNMPNWDAGVIANEHVHANAVHGQVGRALTASREAKTPVNAVCVYKRGRPDDVGCVRQRPNDGLLEEQHRSCMRPHRIGGGGDLHAIRQ